MKKILLFLILFISKFSFGQIPNTLSSADKIFGLSKFWQEVNYNFIYLEKVDRKMWDNKYKELISTIPNTKNDYEYYRELQKFCALLNDGHTNVFFPKGIEQMNTMFGDYRIFIENIDEKAIIVRTNLSKKDEIPLGSEIIEVNNKKTLQYITENVKPYLASSTEYVKNNESFSSLLKGLDGETFKIKIKKPNNDISEFTLTHKRTEEKEVNPDFDPQRNLLDFKWINDEVAYVALNSFADKKIDSLFTNKLPELYKAKSLIIDIRNNGGGSTNIGFDILKYLTNDKKLYGSKSSSRLHIPTFKAWGKYVEAKDSLKDEWSKKTYSNYNDKYYYDFEYEPTKIKLNAKRIVIPTVILIGNNTASAAEDFLIYADKQKHMTKIGTNTFGSTGEPFSFSLPGGGSARICTKKDTYPDGREFVGYGIKPDIEIKPSLVDYLKKNDIVLEKAIEYFQKK